MRVLLVLCAHVALAAASFAAASPESATDTSRWSHRWPVQLAKTPDNGVVEAPLSADVFDVSQPGLADIRILSQGGKVAPCVLRVAAGKTHTVPLNIRLYNQTYVSGKQSGVTADFGEKVMKNRIEVTTPGTNFRRAVRVEASDDGQNWQNLVEGAFLFRVAGGDPGARFDKSTVALPDNDLRYLRVTVFNGADDPEQVEIQNVKAWRVESEPPETVPAPIADTQVVEKEKEHATEITLDLEYRNLPLHELKLKFDDANFFRRIRVSGRNVKERVVEIPLEGGGARKKTVEEPWAAVSSGYIYRYSSGGSRDESLALSLTGACYRYLRVVIENADNPPLGFSGATASRLQHYVAFQPQGEGPWWVYAGNPAAAVPQYDIVHYIGRLRSEGVTAAALGPAAQNPAFGPKKVEIPWSERYKWLIWVALLVVAAALGALIYRQVKAVPKESA